MPELPEVETVARQLAPLVTGRTIRRIVVCDTRLHAARGLKLSSANLQGWTIGGAARCGKQVVLELVRAHRDPRWLVVHLRMTGRLLYFPATVSPPAGQQRCRLDFDSGALGLYDARRFGTVELHSDPAAFSPVGLDPLSPAFTPAVLSRLLRDSRQDLKSWLLRQDRLVGLGNIYVSEVLHGAGISPLRSAGSLDPEQTARLARTIRAVLRAAVRHCGTTFSDFQDAQGLSGGYQRFLRVYGRTGQPCPACGGPIIRLVQQQRSTFYCPACQL